MQSSSFSLSGVVFGLAVLANPLPVRAAFTNVSAQSGITNLHSVPSDGVNHHGGGAVIDVNADGYPDLLLAKFASTPLLYVNDKAGRFVNEASVRGLGAANDASGFGVADFDNDGDVDIFAVTHKGTRQFLLINDGTGKFAEAAADRGAALQTSSRHQSYSVGVVDYDLDGYLDVYVSEWGIPSGSEPELHCALLRNKGAAAPGHFELATTAAGVRQTGNGGQLTGFATGFADFDGDVWPDLALIQDYKSEKLYWNNGDGTFSDTTKASGVGLSEFGMGIAIADYDRDGLLDYYVTSIYDFFSNNKDGSHTGNKLYRNVGGRKFAEVSAAAGVSRTGWGWGTAFLDFDHDGFFDLIATNGINISEGGDRNTLPYVDAANDPTTLFRNNGNGTFSNVSVANGISDTGDGKGLIVWDYDLDGDEDLVVINTFSNPVVYRSDASQNGNNWIRFTFEGTVSNRDAFGTLVRVTEGGSTQTLYYNPSNAYISQREAALHFGLGQIDGGVDLVEVRWPTGAMQAFTDVAKDQIHHLVEPSDLAPPPLVTKQPTGSGTYDFGEELTLTFETVGSVSPAILWEKDGEPIAGATSATLRIPRLAPWDAGVYRARLSNAAGTIYTTPVVVGVDIDLDSKSVAHWWNEFMLEAIRKDFPNPTKHGRNLYHVSGAMWDAFWTYESEAWTKARPVFHGETVDASDWDTNSQTGQKDRDLSQKRAISHAAYVVLKHRYADTPGSARSLYGFRWLMQKYGFDPDDVSVTGNSPAAVGNRIGMAALDFGYTDGSNELDGYKDTSGYTPVNEPLVIKLSGASMADYNRWQPLAFDFAISQNGIPLGTLVQSFLGVNWREVSTFAMKKPTPNTISFDPGPPPLMGTETEQDFLDSAVELIRFSSLLDPNNSEIIDISPGYRLNNPIGTNDGTGYPINPYTKQPYEHNYVKHGDYARILAEFWADGPSSETPPGHWNTLFNELGEHPLLARRYMGVGDELSELEWDIRGYLALNGGMHDAAIAAWTLKRQYDYARPISMIRALGGNGQSSDPNLPSYHPAGLPIVPGLVEPITEESSAPGQRHAHLADDVGKIAVYAWHRDPDESPNQVGGVGWILAVDWFPYQRSTFVTPAFGAYVSGHSTFSRAGAEVLSLLTGSPFYPGGMGEFHFPKGEFLEFEYGPSEDVTLQWATYYDAADQAGLSRLYGGIHVRADDFNGRILGARVGIEAFIKAHTMRNAAAGTGFLFNSRVAQGLGADKRTPLVRFSVQGRGLPIRLVDSTAEAEAAMDPGIYFVLPDPRSASDTVTTVAKGDSIIGVSLDRDLEVDESMFVDFEITAEEPVLLLARGHGASLGAGLADISMRCLEMVDGEWRVVETNDDWKTSVVSSRSDALFLREKSELTLHDSDPAISLSLLDGLYRIEMAAKSGAGRGRLVVTGQNWIDSE